MDRRRIGARKAARSPWIDRMFAYGAMLPLIVGALALWFAPDAQSFLALNLTLFWGASVLLFLSGVRRGASFGQPGGVTAVQILTMLWLFQAGVGSLVATIWAFPMIAALLQMAGYASLAILDPLGSRRGEAPGSFDPLRPVQMLVPILALAVVAARIWTSPYL
ncbi:DUF3429 domain-containing protein [Aurantimonas sp. A2-1-M11]|uniref:DUF3429 domain-containing protein n=1 Tax=Aurantimonas sp. A2-1-M11 TaxID=3113712 RepID=UPI002F94BB7E